METKSILFSEISSYISLHETSIAFDIDMLIKKSGKDILV